MPGARSLPLIGRPNKLRGVYSRPSPGRVLWGDRGAVLGIFSELVAPIGVAISQAVGVKVGREKSAGACQATDFCGFRAFGPLMGRWSGPISGLDRPAPGAPLGAARSSRHPVARSGSEIWKMRWPMAGLNQFLGWAHPRNENSPANGSGCGGWPRKIALKRVGDRLISCENAWLASIFGLSRPGLEAATLGGGFARVN